MLKDVTLGQYYPGDSFVHRLDPRIKIILTLIYIILVFFVTSYWCCLVLALFLALSVIMSKVKLRFVLRSLRPIIFILVLTFVLNIFFVQGKTVLFEWWKIRITLEGLEQALFLTLRLIFLITGTTLLTLTTSPLALTDGLERLMKPLKYIKFPVHALAMMMTIALRFIPTLLEETQKIMKAQSARGADFESGNVFRRTKNMVPLLVPLFISAFRRADELALAMESRCYQGGEGRTRMKILHLHISDLTASLAVAALSAFIILSYAKVIPV
ncbi:MAG: energy-coupling factor transporter transmembrane protein EcfT [Bacillota bacterium]|nr:energy-coupling factor transporter transmembrane protein EcfT [Bacillota bacterium]